MRCPTYIDVLNLLTLDKAISDIPNLGFFSRPPKHGALTREIHTVDQDRWLWRRELVFKPSTGSSSDLKTG